MPFTPAYIAPPQERGTYRRSILRTIVISLMLFSLVMVCLYLHHTAFDSLVTGLADSEKKSSSWIAGEVGYLLPFFVICVFQYAVYHKHDRNNAILQREMAWEILLVALLTYLLLLPFIHHVSQTQLSLKLAADVAVEKTDGDAYQTLFLDLAEWFIRFAIPLALLYVYHNAKARAEQAALEEAEANTSESVSEITSEAACENPSDTASTQDMTKDIPQETAQENIQIRSDDAPTPSAHHT